MAAVASGTSLAPALSTLASTGIRVAVVNVKSNADISTATAGWNKLRQDNSGAALTQAVFIAAVGAATPTFTWSGAAAASAVQLLYDDPTDPVRTASVGAASAGAGSVSPFVAPGITTGQVKSLAIALVSLAGTGSYGTIPANWTQNTNPSSATSATRIIALSRFMDAAGATGDMSITMASPPAWVASQIELQIALPTDLEIGELEIAPIIEPNGLAAAEFELVPILASSRVEVVEIELVPILAPTAGPAYEDAGGGSSLAFNASTTAMLVADSAGAGGLALGSAAASILANDVAGINTITLSGSAAAEGHAGETFAAGLAAAPIIAADLTIATPLDAALIAEPAIGLQLLTSLYMGSAMRARPRLVATLSGLALPTVQVEDPRFVYAHRNEPLDALIWRARGLGSGAVERVLNANPGLAGMGTHLPEGHPVFIPNLGDVRTLNLDLIQLWD